MKLFHMPTDAARAAEAHHREVPYLLSGTCEVCGQPFTIEVAFHHFEPRCDTHAQGSVVERFLEAERQLSEAQSRPHRFSPEQVEARTEAARQPQKPRANFSYSVSLR